MTQPPTPGFRLAPNARIIVLPTCSRCTKVAPQCRCGYPASRLAQAPPHPEENK